MVESHLTDTRDKFTKNDDFAGISMRTFISARLLTVSLRENERETDNCATSARLLDQGLMILLGESKQSNGTGDGNYGLPRSGMRLAILSRRSFINRARDIRVPSRGTPLSLQLRDVG